MMLSSGHVMSLVVDAYLDMAKEKFGYKSEQVSIKWSVPHPLTLTPACSRLWGCFTGTDTL